MYRSFQILWERGLHPDSDVPTKIFSLLGITLPSFGPGEGPIFFHQLRCTGSENRLSDCPKSSSYNTYHSNDAGVRCPFNLSTGNVIANVIPFSQVLP